jgi:pyruvate formate lyase activating enzyme
MTTQKAPFVKEALLYEKEGDNVRCLTCERKCLISPGKRGWCKTRENREGRLFTLIYGSVSSISVNPIEKKPLFHFYPGSKSLTVGSWSCNFDCPWCQNWEISKRVGEGQFISPQEFVNMAIQLQCEGTSISFNEPTLSLEWALGVFELAREKGLYNTFVTNGYMTKEALDHLIRSGLDAMNVDVKGDEEVVRKWCRGELKFIWRNLVLAKERNVHVEITTLVIPTVNDDPNQLRSIGERILKELGRDTPWHLTAYYPAYLFTAPPTSREILERAYLIGKELGLRFVYLGNLPGHPYENTYCPSCGKLLIERYGVNFVRSFLKSPSCPFCGEAIPIIGILK